MSKARQMNKKKKFVADGVFQAELHSFLSRALTDAGYAGFVVRTTPVQTDIEIKAANTAGVTGPEGRKLRELTSLIQKRFGYAKEALQLIVARVQSKGLCAPAQAESLKTKLLAQVPVRTAANAVLKQIMADGAIGAECIISGKLGQQRAKSMKYRAGYIISTGQPKKDLIDVAVRHCFFKQGIIGVKVKIYRPYDPSGKKGIPIEVPDKVRFPEQKYEQEEEEIRELINQ
ncbi:unnamed protein product (macronuclear) [Paramecium tetraurelia]|uniref:40S ribosomal protein S3 n=1 Tax=Paramecium tetraurelia TaxID=5888 RepID=A0DTU4_PARTE|nr:uncharacterized protein GSPATT00020144001 [Paramecium tetraurelia]CAK86461.1 unnamed protein product [Paramecium tetraurelia]|eukprot:XP_001453858.1 hypothetical protein (macronuclear) [Paramecium tetraurelia strain d4-2]